MLLVTIIGAEAALMAGVTIFLGYELATQPTTSVATAIALLVVAAIAAFWLITLTIAMWRGRSWTRGGALVWQFLQVAVGVGSIQGFLPRPDIASWLLIPAIVAIVLLLTPSVSEHLARHDDGPES
ncbi:MAG: hypothetical protein ACLGH5_09670 [Actinomycetes bacterium]|uniref:hypothetical protein n=1 Tax=Microcella alkalica TaxID=355930 RepID=UPI00145D148D|nr:hypothetical protein [Microcella alkalica]